MPPPLPRFGGGPNSIPAQYSQYAPHTQAHPSNLPPPSLGGNPGFMNPSSNINPFANGNALSLGQGFGGGGGGLGGGTGMFASHEAQTRFHNANPHVALHNGMAEPGVRGVDKGRIRQVWRSNLEDEMKLLRAFIDYYPYISMDIEFPGCVARPMGSFRNKADYHYQCIRTNVDLLSVIQVGFTLFNEKGETIPAQRLPPHVEADLQNAPGLQAYRNGTAQLPSTWQFNFKFSLKEDMYADASIKLLKDSGVDFDALETSGIEPKEFGAKLIDSGLVCDEDKHWISFHGGYDFGYLTKILHPNPLPDDEQEFTTIMNKFFPSIWDVKYLLKWAAKQMLSGQRSPDQSAIEILTKVETYGKQSLDAVAEALKVKRIGNSHLAGSDALLTGKTFYAVREKIFHGELPVEINGLVWGLNIPVYSDSSSFNIPHSTPQHYHQQLQENATPVQNSNGAAYANGTPSTPSNSHVGLASTPAPTNHSAIPPITPGGGGGVFGSFQYAK